MKAGISATQRGSSSTVTVTPFSASHSCPPRNVRVSPTSSEPMSNCRTGPLQYQHGDSVVTMTVDR
jgi:hypothetical protein